MPILCVGPNIGLVEEDVMQYASNCADRNVPVSFPVCGTISKNGEDTWLYSGCLAIAKTGVCYLGDWDSLRPAQRNEITSGGQSKIFFILLRTNFQFNFFRIFILVVMIPVLDDGYIPMVQKNGKSAENQRTECLLSSLVLRTAIWTYRKSRKNCGQEKQLDGLENLIK